MAICIFNIFTFFAVKAFYIWRNKSREERWNQLTEQEKIDYIATTEDEGQKRKDFRFAH